MRVIRLNSERDAMETKSVEENEGKFKSPRKSNTSLPPPPLSIHRYSLAHVCLSLS